jgi:hypothetical protein
VAIVETKEEEKASMLLFPKEQQNRNGERTR